MASENSIHLVKDFIIPKTAKQSARAVTNSNIPNLDENSFGKCAHNFGKEIKDFVQMLTGSSVPIYFYVRNSSLNASFNVYYLVLNSRFYQTLNRILSKFSIQVLATVKYSEKTDVSIYDRLFELPAEVDKNGHLQQAIFDNSSLTLESDVTFNIFIKWPELDKIKVDRITVSIRQALFGNTSSNDLKLVAGNGTEVECHRVVFEAHSEELAAMLCAGNGLSESKTGRIMWKDNSEAGIRAFIRYLYCMKLITSDVSCEVAIELFQLARKFKLNQLQDQLRNFFLQKESGWFHPDPLVELYFHVKNLDEFKSLQDHALTLIMRLSSEVRKCKRFKELSRDDSEELLWKICDLRDTTSTK